MKRGTAKLRALLRRRRFLRQYLGGPPGVIGNAEAAVIAAGFTDNEGSAHVIAYRFLHHPEILAEIEKHIGKPNDETERLLRELRAIAYSRSTDIGEWDGDEYRVTPSRLLTDGQAATVQAVEMTETTTENGTNRKVRVQQYSKLEAIKLIALITHKLTMRHEVSGPDGKPIQHQHDHVVFYLPAPTRLRVPVVLDITPSANGDTPALPPTNGQPPDAEPAP